jgi:hypothetical protein
MSLRFGVVVASLVCSLGVAAPALGQERKPSLQDLLAKEIETRDFQEPMPLRQALQLLYEKFSVKGLDLPILVDINSFRKGDDGCPNGPYDDEVRLPAIPKVMTTGDALRVITSQVKANNAAVLLRNGMVEIVNQADATLPALLRYKIRVHFDKMPLADAMRRLSHLSGASIVVDPRLKETAQTPISADFRGDVPLEAAVRIIANLANARIVLVNDAAIYVTTPANAETLEKEIRANKDRS